RMAVWAAQHRHVEHARQLDVVGVRRAAGDEARVLAALDGSAKHTRDGHRSTLLWLVVLGRADAMLLADCRLQRLTMLDRLNVGGNGNWVLDGATTHRGRSTLHGRDNILVTSAAAEVALQLLANLRIGRMWITLQQADRRHQEARGTEATLQA